MYLSTYPSKRDGHPPIYLGGEPPLPTYSGWSVRLSTYVGKDGNTSIYCWSTCLVFQYKQRPGFHEIRSPISICICSAAFARRWRGFVDDVHRAFAILAQERAISFSLLLPLAAFFWL